MGLSLGFPVTTATGCEGGPSLIRCSACHANDTNWTEGGFVHRMCTLDANRGSIWGGCLPWDNMSASQDNGGLRPPTTQPISTKKLALLSNMKTATRRRQSCVKVEQNVTELMRYTQETAASQALLLDERMLSRRAIKNVLTWTLKEGEKASLYNLHPQKRRQGSDVPKLHIWRGNHVWISRTMAGGIAYRSHETRIITST